LLALDIIKTPFCPIIIFYWYRFICFLVNAIASSYEPKIPEAIYNITRKFYCTFGNFWYNEQKNTFLNNDRSADNSNIAYAEASRGASQWTLWSAFVAKSHSASRRQISASFRMQRQLHLRGPTTEFSFRSSLSMSACASPDMESNVFCIAANLLSC